MKNISLGLNIVLTIAVAILFYLHFSKPSNIAATKKVKSDSTQVASDITIAYVNTDSLLNNYELYKKSKKEFEAKRDKLDAELNKKGKTLEEEVLQYQEKAGNMSAELRQITENRLMEKQQKLYQHREELIQKLGDEEQSRNDELFNTIFNFLEKYNEEKGYQYILSYTRGGNVLLANEEYNITKEVLVGLNEEYLASKKK